MIKTILKVVYFTFAAIIGVIVYSMGYQSSTYEAVESKINGFIEKGEYKNVARIFGALFDQRNLALNVESDKLNMAIFAGATELKVNYYTKAEDDKYTTNTFHTYDKAYYIYLFNPTFERQQGNIDGEYIDNTAITFFNEDGDAYNHYFTLNNEVNKSIYVEKPLSVNEALMYGQRDQSTFFSNWGFYNFTFDKGYIDAIVSEHLNGKPITAINVTQGLGDKGSFVLETNFSVNLDFSQEFFTDVNPLVEANSTFIPINDKYQSGSGITKDEYDEAYKQYQQKTDGFQETFFENENYITTFSQSEIVPNTIIWKAIGMEVLYVLVVIILYFLLFKLKWIKSLIFRDRKGRNIPNKISPKKEAIDAKYQEINNQNNNNNK